MLLLSIDQSTVVVGWSLFDTETKSLINYGVQRYERLDINDEGALDKRISEIKKYVNKLIKITKAEIFALEHVQFQKNAQTLIKLTELLGVLSNNFYDKKYCFFAIEPSKWKGFAKIKGRKREEQKLNTIKFVKERFNVDVTEDEADAIGIGYYVVNNILKGNN